MIVKKVKNPDDNPIPIRFGFELRNYLRRKAHETDRSVSYVVRKMVREFFNKEKVV